MNFADHSPVRSYVRRFWRPFLLGTITLAATNLFDILTPFALKRAIDAIAGNDPGALRDSVILYIAFMIGTVSFRQQWRIHFGRFHHSVADDLRNRIFAKFTELGPRFFEKNPTGELMSLMINDVNTFRMAVGPGLLILIDAFFLVAFILPFMLTISPDWTWKTMILLPAIPFVIRFMEDRIAKASREQQDRLAEMSGFSQELVAGIRVIKGFAQEAVRQSAFRLYSQRYEQACNKLARLDALFEPILQVGIATGSVVLLAWGTKDVLSGAVSLGTFVAFHEYIKRMIWPMSAIGSGLSMLQQGRGSYGRIFDVLTSQPEVADNKGLRISGFESLEFRNLTFTYPDATRPALKNVSFQIRKGEILGIVGPVGSGKSTIIQILGRIRPAPDKSVFVNELAVEDINVTSWREHVTVAPQEAFLFSRTVQDNILFGTHTTKSEDEEMPEKVKEALWDSASTVAMRDEIEKMPLGFRAWLGEKGVNLSGGQRQRLTIARALSRTRSSKFANLLVLDDSLSAVDSKTESDILRQLKTRQSQASAIIISHRLAALAFATRILVLNEGETEAIGTHSELLQKSPTYRRLFELQTARSSGPSYPGASI